MKHAFRQLAKSPGFTTVAILSLALGIGANTALFSLVDDLLLRSLPVKNPDELAIVRYLTGPNGMFNSHSGIFVNDPATGLRSSTSTSYFVFERLRDHPGPFQDLFAFAELQQLNVGVDREAEITSGQLASGNYYSALGVAALRGRTLEPRDDLVTAPPVAVISYRYWQRRFGGRDDAIGKVIQINNVAVTVVGVTPRAFNGTLSVGFVPDLTLPISLDSLLNSGRNSLRESNYWWIQIMGRLRPGVTLAAAQAQLEPVFIQAARDGWVAAKVTRGPNLSLEERANPHLRLQPGGQGLTESRSGFVPPLRILTCIAGVVLVIACVNVANLLLARSASRAREMAVRLALGATRGRLIRQLLTESLLLAILGGAAGIVFAFWGRDALLQLRPIDGTGTVDLNLTVLGFTLAVATLTGLLFGIVPAWRATRVDLNSTLKTGPEGTAMRGRFSLRRGLMVVQIALSVVLLVGAALFLRTLHNLRSNDAGFNRENVMLFRVDASLSGYKPADTVALFDRLVDRLALLPGATSVGFSRHPLLSGSRRGSSIGVPGSTVPAREQSTSIQIVSPGFLPTMEIPILLGRNVSERDTVNSAPVAVVNERFARTYFGDATPIGRTFTLRERAIEIIGVARDARYDSLRAPIPTTVYLPFGQEISGQASFAIRAVGDPSALAPAIRSVVREVDANLPLFELRTQEEQITRLVRQERMFATLTTFFGALALLLTCVGLYGLLAHQVTSRTREIGIRMALGAQLRSIMSLVLGEGLRLSALGVVLGIGASVALTRLVSSVMFGVQPHDPLSLIAAGALLLSVAALACWLPARRAARVDPMKALRAE
jgi:predicted permease